MQRGKVAEDLAATHLAARGLQLVARNWRCRGGEIDLVMREGATLVFVEVRARAGDAFGGAAASITPAKQRRIILAARQYLAALSRMPPCRFDVVLIDGDRLTWLKDAFQAAA